MSLLTQQLAHHLYFLLTFLLVDLIQVALQHIGLLGQVKGQ